MPETIEMGLLTLKFLQSKHDTGGSIDMFEMTAQHAGTALSRELGETIYGLTGITTWRLDGKDIDVGPG